MQAELLPAGTAGAAARPHGNASRQLTRFPSSGALADAPHLLQLVDTPEETWRLTISSTRARTAERHGDSVLSPSHMAGPSPPSSSSDTMEPDNVTMMVPRLPQAAAAPNTPQAALNTPRAAAAPGQLAPAAIERPLLSTLPAAGAFRGIYREAGVAAGGEGAVAPAWAWRWDDNAQATHADGLTHQLANLLTY